jgi:hypothetical protein
MEVTGQVKRVNREIYGDNKTKYQVILDTTEKQEYPKMLALTFIGKSADKVVEHNLVAGTKVKIAFDVESREYNGKYYTDAKGYKIEVLGSKVAQVDTTRQLAPANDDLPF